MTNKADHDILIELRTLLGEVIRRLDDNIKVTTAVQAEVDKIKEDRLKENLAIRVTKIENDHDSLPLKEKELAGLITWGSAFRERYKLVVGAVAAVGAFVGFIIGIAFNVLNIIRP